MLKITCVSLWNHEYVLEENGTKLFCMRFTKRRLHILIYRYDDYKNKRAPLVEVKYDSRLKKHVMLDTVSQRVVAEINRPALRIFPMELLVFNQARSPTVTIEWRRKGFSCVEALVKAPVIAEAEMENTSLLAEFEHSETEGSQGSRGSQEDEDDPEPFNPDTSVIGNLRRTIGRTRAAVLADNDFLSSVYSKVTGSSATEQITIELRNVLLLSMLTVVAHVRSQV